MRSGSCDELLSNNQTNIRTGGLAGIDADDDIDGKSASRPTIP